MSKPTVDEMRDYVALHLGNKRLPFWTETGTVEQRWKGPHSPDMWAQEHPLPYTLDAIAAALPPGWEWNGILLQMNQVWYASAMNLGLPIGNHTVHGEDLDEKSARLRAVYAAWRRVGGHT